MNAQAVSLATCPATWKTPCEVEVAPLLRAGANRLEVTVSNASAPPALWLTLRGPGLELHSDAAWDASLAGAATLSARIASAAPKGPRFYPLVDTPSPVQALARRWPSVLGLALLAAALALGLAFVARRLPPSGDTDKSPWPLRLVLSLAALAWIALFVNNMDSLPIECSACNSIKPGIWNR